MNQSKGASLGEIRTKEAFQAAEEGNLERLKWLVECGFAEPGERTEEGDSLLHMAVRSGSTEVVRYLTERVGLNPMKANLSGVTPWDEAHRDGDGSYEDEAGRDGQKGQSAGRENGPAAWLSAHMGFALEDTYHNPVRRGFFPDPSIVRVENDFYMVNSSFCFFPCIPVSHSKDLIHWEIVGYAITEADWAGIDDLNGGMGYWAPDISYYKGRFTITATLRKNDDCEVRRVQMVTSSERAEGPYDKPVFLPIDGIDPSIFRDDDGKTYMLVNRGARLFELSEDCREVLADRGLLWYGDDKRKPEGPHLLKRDGFYYLFLAEGGTGMGHCVTVARSEKIDGPYEPCPHNPILHQWDEKALIQCTGHGKPVQLADGRWYMVYLGLRKPGSGYGILGRETCLDPMDWTAEGWPRVNGGRGPSDQQKLPLPEEGENAERKEHLAKEKFSLPEEGGHGTVHYGYPGWQGQDWMTPRTLPEGRLSVQDGILSLTGSEEDLNTTRCRSVFVKRQESFRFSAALTFRIPALLEGQSLGLTCYYDENSYIKYGVACREKKLGILLQEYVGDACRTDAFVPLPARPAEICLRVTVDHLKRSFACRTGADWVTTGTLSDTSYLSSEGLSKGKRFTGATLGVYVHGTLTGEFCKWEEI